MVNADLKLSFTHVPTNTAVTFTAFLETFGDSYDAEWSSEKVFGRMDPITQYKGTARKINVSFTVPSESHEEALHNHMKISTLLQMMYPSFEFTGDLQIYTITAPPLMKVKFNNLIRNEDSKTNGLLGFIPSIKYEPNMDSNIFSINNNTIDISKLKKYLPSAKQEMIPKTDDTLICFQSYKIGFDLNVLHTHALGFTNGQSNLVSYPYGFNILGG